MGASPTRRIDPVPAKDADGITIRVITEQAEFLALQPDWDALFARAALPHQLFQSHVVLRHWTTHYRDPRQDLSIVAAWRGDRLVMVWPLVRQDRLGLDMLRFMGIPVAQFGDILVDPEDDADALLLMGWNTVRVLGADIFEARKLRADSVLARSGLLTDGMVLETQNAPFADLDVRVGPEGPGAIYEARERSNHRRRLRRLRECGTMRLDSFAPGPAAAGLARDAVAMKRDALTRHGVLAPAIADPRFSAFFVDLAGDISGGSPLRVSVILLDDAPIGIDLSLDCGNVSFGHVLATHPGHERSGVGGLLVHHAFACASTRGSTRFDLLAPADPYKSAHADGMTAIADIVMPLTLKGRLLYGLGLKHLRPALKTVAKSLPAGLTTGLLGGFAAWNAGSKG